MAQAPKKRLKSRSITMYVDPKYNDKLLYLRHTIGVTKFFEQCLEDLKVDEEKVVQLKDAIESAKIAYTTEKEETKYVQ